MKTVSNTNIDSVQTQKSELIAKTLTYAGVYSLYCTFIAVLVQSGELFGMSNAMTSTVTVMTGYTSFIMYPLINKKILQPLINVISNKLSSFV